ncbi:MAG: oligosaccharide flippase family protein [Bacteroidota bacterium]|nr:oligosaccharide flippase family protein [Bacteroidota bacterium]MDP4229792.1 oligosaccharide flippase family protein [Bacteroidota bacterium]MDP4236669.1 oligosaccharide flippase family protein [Bacteroidota bacterium]
MRKELAALSKETLIYGGSTVIVRFLNFLLVPFYVNVLATTAEYGVTGSVYAWIAFLNVIYPLGLEGAFFRYASRGEDEVADQANERKLFSSSFNILAIFGVLLSLAIFFLASVIAPPIFHDPKMDITPQLPMFIRVIRYSSIIMLFDSLSVLPFAALRLERKPKIFGLIKIMNVVTMLALNFILILGMHTGVEGIFIANMIASILTFVILIPTFYKKWALSFDRAAIRRMLPFGLTNVPAYLGAMMVQVIDRPIVQTYLGLGAVGVYQANYRMGFIMMVFVSLFEYAWRPFFMRQHKTNDAQARILFARIFTYFMLISLVAFLLLAFFLPYILTTPIFGRQLLPLRYAGGMSIIPVVLFAYIFQGMYTNFIAGIYIEEKNRSLPLITGLGAATNIIVNVILIPIMGIMGAAIATLAAYIVMAFAIYRVAQKAYFIAYDWNRVGRLFLIVGLAYGAERFIVLENIMTDATWLFLLRLGLTGVAVVTLSLTGFFSEREIKFLKEKLRIAR